MGGKLNKEEEKYNHLTLQAKDKTYGHTFRGRKWYFLANLLVNYKYNYHMLIRNEYHNKITTHVAKIIKIIGSSDKGWTGAAQAAVDEAKKTLHGIHGIEITDMTAKVDPNTGKIRLRNIIQL